MGHVYTVGPEHSFLEALVHYIKKTYAAHPLEAASVTIYMPTQRSCRILTQKFMSSLSPGAAFALPQILPLSRIGMSEPSLTETSNTPIPDLTRKLLMLSLVRKAEELSRNTAKSLKLSEDLLALFDQIYAEELDFKRLHDIVPDELSSHWQLILSFLEQITEFWPHILKEAGYCESMPERIRIIKDLLTLWDRSPPTSPVYIAGSTLGLPIYRELARACLKHEKTHLILPPLDLDHYTPRLEPHLPYYLIDLLLEDIKLDPAQISYLIPSDSLNPHKSGVITQAFSPAPFSPDFDIKSGLSHLQLIECKTEFEEASLIATLLQDSYHDRIAKAVLITSDRTLAYTVKMILKSKGIDIDDSIGDSLAHLKIGSFLILILEWVLNSNDPACFFALLSHPLLQSDLTPLLITRIEEDMMRPYLWSTLLSRFNPEDDLLYKPFERIYGFLNDFKDQTISLKASFQSFFKEHLALFERLIPQEKLEAQEDYELFLKFKEEIETLIINEDLFSLTDYRAIFDTLIKDYSDQNPIKHPHLAILGPIEARLQHFDRIILGGMNEGSYPTDLKEDPWMSHAMRKAFGLSDPAQRIGIQAYDFINNLYQNDVIITRSLTQKGTPQIPSRFVRKLIRLKNLYDPDFQLSAQKPWLDWAKALNKPESPIFYQEPEPLSTPDLFPQKLSITDITTLIASPYQIYVKHILKLQEPFIIESRIPAFVYGQIIHKVLECYKKERLNPDLITLSQKAHTLLYEWTLDPEESLFIPARLKTQLDEFLKAESEQALHYQTIETESRHEKSLQIADRSITLFGKLDRIDRSTQGFYDIIDYKTGGVPSKSEVVEGLMPQLLLSAFLYRDDLSQIGRLSYWQLKGGRQEGQLIRFESDLQKIITDFMANLTTLLASYLKGERRFYVTYERCKDKISKPYLHLTRQKEWGQRESEECYN